MEIELGKVIKPQGIKGELKVEPLSNPEFFKSVELIKINKKEVKIVSASIRDEFVYLKINICNDRDTAETFRGAIITVDRESLPELEQDQFFYDDLIGCQIYLENNECVGEIVDIENYGNVDILNIHKGFSTTPCPYVAGLFKSVDIKNKKIIVDKKRYGEVTDYED